MCVGVEKAVAEYVAGHTAVYLLGIHFAGSRSLSAIGYDRTHFVQHTDHPGKEQILSVPMDFSFMNAAQKKDLIHQFEVLPGVMEVLPSDVNYLRGMSGTSMFTEKGNRDSYVAVNVMRITSGFFHFMHIPMLSGQSVREPADLVVDEALSKRIGKEVLGKPLYNYDETPYLVKGVCQTFVTNVYYESEGFILC